ncbi:MAG: universal stress protein [Alphaproteobacteria bacterium]
MHHILTLIDGSVYSESVCDYTAWAAGRMDASVELLHVLGRRDISSTPADFSGNLSADSRETLLAELAALDEQKAKLTHQRARIILDEAKDRLGHAGISEVSTRLRHGDLIETVQAFEAASDLVVIGKRGEGADFARLHLGSNLERVARSTHKPLLVAARAFKPVKNLLIAFDGGASATKAVNEIAGSMLFRGLDCRLLTVGNDIKENIGRLDKAAETLRFVGYNVETEIVSGSPDAVIASRADAGEIDLLVMGAYGHSRIRNLIIGSTTTEMIRSCKIPIMLFR